MQLLEQFLGGKLRISIEATADDGSVLIYSDSREIESDDVTEFADQLDEFFTEQREIASQDLEVITKDYD